MVDQSEEMRIDALLDFSFAALILTAAFILFLYLGLLRSLIMSQDVEPFRFQLIGRLPLSSRYDEIVRSKMVPNIPSPTIASMMAIIPKGVQLARSPIPAMSLNSSLHK